MDYGATAVMPQVAVKQYLVWRFDSIEVGETNYYYSHVSQQPNFELFFVFSLILVGMQDSILLFSSRSHTQFLQLYQF